MYDVVNMTNINSSAEQARNTAYFAVAYCVFLVAICICGIYVWPRCHGSRPSSPPV